ncbi:hypothetical protein ACSBR2_003566 [Camellia fascicularis]
MGFKRSPQPYLFLLSLSSGLKRHKHRGVNFASGGVGLLDVTNEAMKVASLTKQIKQFIIVHNNRVAITGPNETETMLSKSLFCISVGSNDIFAYFSSNRTIPPDLFIANLMRQYEAYINVWQAIREKHNVINLTFHHKDGTEFKEISLSKVVYLN